MPNLQGIPGFFCAGFFEKSRCFSLRFEGLGLVNIDPRHQPVKLPPGKIPDLRLLPGPLIAAADRQALIDQDEAVRFFRIYSRDETPGAITPEAVLPRLRRTEDVQYPYYLPQTKRLGILTIRMEDLV